MVFEAEVIQIYIFEVQNTYFEFVFRYSKKKEKEVVFVFVFYILIPNDLYFQILFDTKCIFLKYWDGENQMFLMDERLHSKVPRM